MNLIHAQDTRFLGVPVKTANEHPPRGVAPDPFLLANLDVQLFLEAIVKEHDLGIIYYPSLYIVQKLANVHDQLQCYIP